MTARELTLSDAAVAFGGTLLYPDCRFSSVSTDSRTLATGDVFVALRGESYDAHHFLKAVASRAGGLVVQYPDKQLDIPQWVVPDTTQALGQLAILARQQFSGPLIAITGSSGKTTVKEMLAAILRCRGPVLATVGNLNNHFGVPKTLLSLRPEHRFAVIEMGASAAGEIDYLTHLARPSVAVVNNVLPAHVEGFGSIAGVAAAKAEIYRGLDANGTAILNLDEPWVRDWRADLTCLNTLTFSVSRDDADLRAANVELDIQGCAAFQLRFGGASTPVRLSIPGRHNVGNALAAAACAVAVGTDLADVAAGLEALAPVAGRMQVRKGGNQSQVIDDSYNANPGSVKAAIDVLASLDGVRVLVLGDMAELGAEAARLHREVGAYARAQGIEKLFAVGALSANTVAGFGGDARLFEDKQALGEYLLADLKRGVTVLVKGSRSAGMEAIVQLITAEEKG